MWKSTRTWNRLAISAAAVQAIQGFDTPAASPILLPPRPVISGSSPSSVMLRLSAGLRGAEAPRLPAVPRLQLAVDALASRPHCQNPEQRFRDGEDARHPSFGPLEGQGRVVEVLRQPAGFGETVRREAVGNLETLLEAAMTGPERDEEPDRLVRSVVEAVQRAFGRNRLLARGQDAGLATDHPLQRALHDLEVLGVGEVVVGRRAPAGGGLYLDKGAFATRLLAGLQEGRVVLLDRVVDPAPFGRGVLDFRFVFHDCFCLFVEVAGRGHAERSVHISSSATIAASSPPYSS